MIVEPRVFDDTHVPRELPHRNNELEALADALDPGPTGGGVDDVLIAGPSGVGKTALAKHYLTRAVEHEDIQWAHIQCLGQTEAAILRAAVRSLGSRDIPENTSLEQAHQELKEIVEATRSVLILDEADDLPETRVLDHLAGIPQLSLIVICHDRERWLSRLDDDHQRRFRRVIEPDRYTVDELTDILEPRVRQGLAGDVVTNSQLRDLADASAGVARRGIQSLRAAAELAGERAHEEIMAEDIADSFERARKQIREMNLKSLGYHHHVLYEIIRAAGTIRAATLNHRYEEHAEELYGGLALTPISRRWRRTKLAKLTEYDLVDCKDGSGSTVYQTVDNEISSEISPLRVLL